MAYELPKLPYANNALEPHIDARTMEIHHTKHHQAYITNVNNALKDQPALAALDVGKLIADLSKVPEAIRTVVRNNGGGHLNHSMFWEIMKPKGGGDPTGPIADQIKKDFGSFNDFKTQFEEKTAAQFGSGWGWLVWSGGKLSIVTTPNQDNPITDGKYPVLGNDVWEHAYYLKYQNKRPDYLKAWWNTVNWDKVNERFATAQKS